MTDASSRDSKSDPSDLNTPRRAVIDRTAVVYGQTPRGIRKKQLQKIAAEMNMDLETLSRKIVSLSEQEQFTFLRSYYEKLNDNLVTFFERFDSYKPNAAEVSENSCNNRKSTFSSKKSRSKVSYHRISDKNCRVTKSGENDRGLLIRELTPPNFITEPTRTSLDMDASLDQSTDLTYDKSMRPISDGEKGPPKKTKSELSSAKCSKTENEYKNEYKSVITSILFDNEDSKLRKLSSHQWPKKSPTKHNTVLETLLFE